MDYFEEFRIKPGSRVKLAAIDASYHGEHKTHEAALPVIEEYARRLRELQYLLYAEHKRSLLICLQGRDAAGKDGTINHVLGAMNPQGCTVTGFKQPSVEEADHDFLWRCHKAAPARGHVAIFNRSHYEDVLIQRVHKMVPESVWSGRYQHINNFEQLLADNHTLILKFYLHIDAEEQLERFRKRIEDPTRHWKISDSDYAEAPFWNEYTAAFEDVLDKCSTSFAPWFVIPANHKWFRNLAISHIVVRALESLKMEFPQPTVDIDSIRKKYHALDRAEVRQGMITQEEGKSSELKENKKNKK
ncbi:polyphosphate kinase 2 family protein [Microbulbifer pacificus]|uniref:Polyphosphate kinase 2 family protein n=1 Tax=Microbulbifer pacificus TaxID=407164 RepID=A0AAU0MW68_9GAMM|nr:polyphosphate kinase 2 family protein [Microbulbifer pacificus]WOX04136.1 polyphosphate kinase 2 family protein [Microbulbifer pacificus]